MALTDLRPSPHPSNQHPAAAGGGDDVGAGQLALFKSVGQPEMLKVLLEASPPTLRPARTSTTWASRSAWSCPAWRTKHSLIGKKFYTPRKHKSLPAKRERERERERCNHNCDGHNPGLVISLRSIRFGTTLTSENLTHSVSADTSVYYVCVYSWK